MNQHGQIIISKSQEDEIKSLLDSKGIGYSDIMLFSSAVEIAKIAFYNIPWVEIAGVISLWIRAKHKRKVVIGFADGSSIDFKGYSPKEIEEIMKKHKQYYVHFDDE